MDKPAQARLAFWALNMTAATSGKNNWPGFIYTEPEWARLTRLADVVDGAAFTRYLLIVTAIFIAFASCAVAALFIPLMTALYPNTADTPALPFVLLLAATALLSIGIGLPLSMRIAARASTSAAMLGRLQEETGDAALAAKAAHQITRMTVIMCGILVPGTLLWIAFDIQGGPIITSLKWLAIGLMGGSMVHTIKSRKRQPQAGAPRDRA